MTTRSWRDRHRAEDGKQLHHVLISITTDVLDAIEELAARDRISRAYAGGRLVELGLRAEEKVKPGA